MRRLAFLIVVLVAVALLAFWQLTRDPGKDACGTFWSTYKTPDAVTQTDEPMLRYVGRRAREARVRSVKLARSALLQTASHTPSRQNAASVEAPLRSAARDFDLACRQAGYSRS